MKIQLSEHFGCRKLLRFTFPSIIMMVFTSIYGVVDGFFISNFVGTTEFAAVNLIMPFLQLLGCFGFMFGAGGSALVAKTLGENRPEKANRIFSMIIYVAAALGTIFAILGVFLVKPVSLLLGADEKLLPFCEEYGKIVAITVPAFMLQNAFQSFLITAEKPKLGLAITVAAGVTNMVLDALFVAVFKWGVAGAAAATCVAQCVGCFAALIYFVRKNNGLLRLGKTEFDIKTLLVACANGSSELVSNVSMSVVAILYNFQLMKIAGENGVAAYGAVMYVSFIFTAVFFGYSVGVSPVISFHYGALDEAELKSLFKRSNALIIAASVVLSVISFLLAAPLAKFFLGAEAVKNNPELIEMTVSAFRFYSGAVLFGGFSIFGSAFFTSLNDGAASAAISFMRTLVFQVASVLVLPMFLGLNGVWASLFAAEVLAAGVTFVFYLAMRKKYKY